MKLLQYLTEQCLNADEAFTIFGRTVPLADACATALYTYTVLYVHVCDHYEYICNCSQAMWQTHTEAFIPRCG